MSTNKVVTPLPKSLSELAKIAREKGAEAVEKILSAEVPKELEKDE